MNNETFQKTMATLQVSSKRPYMRSAVKLGDGTVMSVQASMIHCCEPKETGIKNYALWEVGYPTKEVEEFLPYALEEDLKRPTDTVYNYVPTEVILTAIESRGGTLEEVTS